MKKNGLIIEDIPFKTLSIWEVVIDILNKKHESQLIKTKNFCFCNKKKLKIYKKFMSEIKFYCVTNKKLILLKIKTFILVGLDKTIRHIPILDVMKVITFIIKKNIILN